MDRIKEIIEESKNVKESICIKALEEAVSYIVSAYRNGGKVLLFGNGGSAADAQHIAAELVGRFKKNRTALPAVALTTDTSIITAISNDFSYTDVFVRQVQALCTPKDVVIGISTSGKSPNVVEAIKIAKEKGAKTIALTGEGGGVLKEVADLCIEIASKNTPRIQEAHILCGHIICELVEEALFGGEE